MKKPKKCVPQYSKEWKVARKGEQYKDEKIILKTFTEEQQMFVIRPYLITMPSPRVIL